MLPYATAGTRGPIVVMLHWLGGSAGTWKELSHSLSRRGLRCFALNLPGFGDAADIPGYTVEAMAGQVEATIGSLLGAALADDVPLLLAGHSMGGKVAAVLARRAAEGSTALANLRGLILISPSPPAPEPMTDAKRKQMLDSLGQSTGDATEDRKRATKFVKDNVGKLPLEDDVLTRTVDAVLAMNRTAFRAWLTGDAEHAAGSREDWSADVGKLPYPAIIFAGTEDAALGPDAQRQFTLPHFDSASLITLHGSGHLSPVERPAELAGHIVSFARLLGLNLTYQTGGLSPAFATVLRSERTSPQTRAVMESRLAQDAPQSAFALTQMLTLRALVDAVVPDAPFDLARRLSGTLAAGTGDGWRYDELPADLTAWRTGLLTLESAAMHAYQVSFSALHLPQQRALLERAQQGKLHRTVMQVMHFITRPALLTGPQMKLWFEDVRGTLARLYAADPRTMDRIGFLGFADGESHDGFTQIELGNAQEPLPHPSLSSLAIPGSPVGVLGPLGWSGGGSASPSSGEFSGTGETAR